MDMEKATEKGIQRVARKVLASFFSLNEEEKDEDEEKSAEGSNETEEVKETAKAAEPEAEQQQAETSPAFTVSWSRLRVILPLKRSLTNRILMPGQYAIRHTMRNHTILKSEAIIKMIAGMVKPEHKVNLRTPDKVILVEIFQVCHALFFFWTAV
jgi:tRNA acetyltransferase TAN1